MERKWKNKVDMYKKGYQTGEFNKKQLTDFYKIGNLYCDNVHFEQKYIEIENDQRIVSEELFEIEMYGKFIGRVKNVGMKQPNKLDVILNRLTNMDTKFTNAIESLDNKFTNAISEIKTEIKTMDTKFTNAIGEIKTEIKEIKNDIKDIKSCPTIKKELKMLRN